MTSDPSGSSPDNAPHSAAGQPLGDDARHLLGLLAHELRTPLGAIIGYHELLVDGLMGVLPERALDAVRRMGTSGAQLRHLIDGLSDVMLADEHPTLELAITDSAEIATVAAESARALAAGRGVQLQVRLADGLPSLVTDPARLAAALDLAIGAAVRASPGATLQLAFEGDAGALLARVDGCLLDPVRDTPPHSGAGGVSTGAGLRLLMADRMVRLLGGELRLRGASPATLVVRVPPHAD